MKIFKTTLPFNGHAYSCCVPFVMICTQLYSFFKLIALHKRSVIHIIQTEVGNSSNCTQVNKDFLELSDAVHLIVFRCSVVFMVEYRKVQRVLKKVEVVVLGTSLYKTKRPRECMVVCSNHHVYILASYITSQIQQMSQMSSLVNQTFVYTVA